MFDDLKKTFLTGIDFALKSKADIEKFAKEFAKESDMNKAQAQQFFEDCQQKYEGAKESLDQKIESTITKIMVRLDLPTRKEIEELNQKIDKLKDIISRQKE
ncbi:MAG: hypothetical protein GY729_20135 [Desulfobacteraceae bacterium]|nr:hypothetical protein [Desulfobacteraceae bacterium]